MPRLRRQGRRGRRAVGSPQGGDRLTIARPRPSRPGAISSSETSRGAQRQHGPGSGERAADAGGDRGRARGVSRRRSPTRRWSGRPSYADRASVRSCVQHVRVVARERLRAAVDDLVDDQADVAEPLASDGRCAAWRSAAASGVGCAGTASGPGGEPVDAGAPPNVRHLGQPEVGDDRCEVATQLLAGDLGRGPVRVPRTWPADGPRMCEVARSSAPVAWPRRRSRRTSSRPGSSTTRAHDDARSLGLERVADVLGDHPARRGGAAPPYRAIRRAPVRRCPCPDCCCA